jgi:hypothetical protein
LGDDELLIRLHEAVKQRNLQTGATVTIQEESVPVILSEYNQLDNGSFLEPEFGAIVTVNHFNLVKTSGVGLLILAGGGRDDNRRDESL